MLFSVLGVVALLTTAHASGLAQTIASDAPDVTPSATDGTTPTDTPTPTPTQTPTPTPVPTKAPTKQPTSASKASASTPTPVPTSAPGSGNVPIAGATALALGPGGTQITPTPHKDKPTPTPSPGATTTPAGSGQNAVPSANTISNTAGTTDNTAHNGMMTPLTASLAGAGAFIVLSTTGLVGLVVWRRRKATQMAGALVAQTPWPEQPVLLSGNYYSQPTEFAAPAASGAMIPFALQGFSQYSPMLGAPDASQLNAPTSLPASDFRPLQLDFPQIIGMNDGASIHTPLPAEQISPANWGMSFPQPPSTPAQAEPALLDLQSVQPGNLPEHQEPQSDPFLEAMMQRAQMGIFALPGKDS